MTLMSHDNDGKCCVQRTDYERLRSLLRRCEEFLVESVAVYQEDKDAEPLLVDIRASLSASAERDVLG